MKINDCEHNWQPGDIKSDWICSECGTRKDMSGWINTHSVFDNELLTVNAQELQLGIAYPLTNELEEEAKGSKLYLEFFSEEDAVRLCFSKEALTKILSFVSQHLEVFQND